MFIKKQMKRKQSLKRNLNYLISLLTIFCKTPNPAQSNLSPNFSSPLSLIFLSISFATVVTSKAALRGVAQTHKTSFTGFTTGSMAGGGMIQIRGYDFNENPNANALTFKTSSVSPGVVTLNLPPPDSKSFFLSFYMI